MTTNGIDPETVELLEQLAKARQETKVALKGMRDAIDRLDENDAITSEILGNLCRRVARIEVDMARVDAD